MAKKFYRIWALAEVSKVVEIDLDAPETDDEFGDEPEEMRFFQRISNHVDELFGQGVDRDMRDYGYDEVDLEAEAKAKACAEAKARRRKLEAEFDGTCPETETCLGCGKPKPKGKACPACGNDQ